MEFYTVYKEPRPVRLCEATRQFAYDSLENHAYGLEAMKTAALLQKGWRRDPAAFKLQELMQVATENGAAALHTNAGEIAVGKLADLILVDTDNYAFVPQLDLVSNFIYSANSSCIDTVICNGEIVMENREVPGEKEILENACRICKKLYNN